MILIVILSILGFLFAMMTLVDMLYSAVTSYKNKRYKDLVVETLFVLAFSSVLIGFVLSTFKIIIMEQ